MIGITNAKGVGGGGGGLNVVVGLSEPTNPKENTVWVKSDKAGKKYVFAEAKPSSPTEGLIWFSVTSSGIITLAAVYADGAWINVDVYMYLAGSWVIISITELILLPSEYGSSIDKLAYVQVTTPNDIITIKGSSSEYIKWTYGFTVLVDVTSYKKLNATFTNNIATTDGILGLGIGTTIRGYNVAKTEKKSLSNSTYTVSVLLTDLTGKYYVSLYGDYVRSMTINKVWLE